MKGNAIWNFGNMLKNLGKNIKVNDSSSTVTTYFGGNPMIAIYTALGFLIVGIIIASVFWYISRRRLIKHLYIFPTIIEHSDSIKEAKRFAKIIGLSDKLFEKRIGRALKTSRPNWKKKWIKWMGAIIMKVIKKVIPVVILMLMMSGCAYVQYKDAKYICLGNSNLKDVSIKLDNDGSAKVKFSSSDRFAYDNATIQTVVETAVSSAIKAGAGL